MERPPVRRVAYAAVAIVLILGVVGPALASPAPISACPPCDRGFARSAATHGLETDVRAGSATVRIHRNGSATWTARAVPTNETVLARLADNRSLARRVAKDSFGTRYGNGIDHELLATSVTDDAFVVRYRTHDVVQSGPFGSYVLTYFRDEPGAYVYTGLGADEMTVVAPGGTTVARGFGTVTDGRLTATELPDVPNGPFVVVAPADSPAPGLVGTLAVASLLSGVIARNVVLFVALPGSVLVGGLAGIRRVFGGDATPKPVRFGAITAAGGLLLLAATVVGDGVGLSALSRNLTGSVGGGVLLALGASVAIPDVRRHLTGPRLVGAALALGVGIAFLTEQAAGAGDLHQSLALLAALLPGAVGLGWHDAQAGADGTRSRRLFVALVVAVAGVLVVAAPLTSLGGSLFVLVPLLLTGGTLLLVAVAVPLYLLGAAGATAERARG
jgi:hypothetical protein